MSRTEDGAASIEYGLIAAFIAAVVAVTIGFLGEGVLALFVETVTEVLPG